MHFNGGNWNYGYQGSLENLNPMQHPVNATSPDKIVPSVMHNNPKDAVSVSACTETKKTDAGSNLMKSDKCDTKGCDDSESSTNISEEIAIKVSSMLLNAMSMYQSNNVDQNSSVVKPDNYSDSSSTDSSDSDAAETPNGADGVNYDIQRNVKNKVTGLESVRYLSR